MARITINNELTVNGKMSISRVLTDEETGAMQVTGILMTHLYFEEINSLESNRYKLKNVNVFREDFGTDDYNVIYSFKAEDLDIKGVEAKGATFILSPEEMKRIEDIMYKDDIPIVGSIGPQYKNLIEINGDEDDKK